MSCGGGSSPAPSTPTSPTTPSAPPPPPTAPANTWSVAGYIVETVSRGRVAGATLTPAWALEAVTAAADGSFTLGAVANPPTSPYNVGVSAPGYVSRNMWLMWQPGARSDVSLDIIKEAAPFSMEFYRQLVRGTYDSGGPWPVLRWTEQPRFYLKTVDQNGRPVEPEVLTVMLDAIARAVPAFTGNRMTAIIERGTEARGETTGWINVNVVRDPDEERTCGYASVGRNPGTITFNSDVCSCGSIKIPGTLVFHEVGHALGFFHVSDRDSVMYPLHEGGCPAGSLSPAESFHAAIAYSRPRGNTEPDNDPSTSRFVDGLSLWAAR